jgi:uncharacterized protein (DUF2062 family)
LGSLLTNTWATFLIFIIASKLGFAILDLRRFGPKGAILSMMAGCLLVALFLGLLAYLSALIVILVFRKFRRRKGGSDENKS